MQIVLLLPITALASLSLLSSFHSQESDGYVPTSPITQGPFIGHVSDTTAFFWARADAGGEFWLTVKGEGGFTTTQIAVADDASDGALRFGAGGLSPSTQYEYTIAPSTEPRDATRPVTFTTAPAPEADSRVRLAFASCAREDEVTAATWARVEEEAPDAMILLGDTPYIDSTDLARQRARYAAFADFEPLRRVLSKTPWYATWDDHDFGRDNTDGRLADQEISRQVFLEFHAEADYGEEDRGIYSSFRRGGVEVFLLDTRSFAAIEPSPFKEHRASLLGAAQWKWLEKGLRASTAPVKILCCGMVWNGAVRPGKLDHWGSYPYERDGLFRFIGEESIGGVVLIGGDIHRSRIITHASKELSGYDITELIVSPMHGSVIEAANQPHPGLVKDMGEPQTFLVVEIAQKGGQVDSATYRFVNAAGRTHYAAELSW